MLSRNTKQYAKTMTYKQCGQVEGIKFLFACKYFMFLIATGSLLKIVAAKCWIVPDSHGIERTGAIEDPELLALTLCKFNLRYSGNVSSYSDLWAGLSIFSSTFLFTGSQFNFAMSSTPANLLVTNPAHTFCSLWRSFIWNAGRGWKTEHA